MNSSAVVVLLVCLGVAAGDDSCQTQSPCVYKTAKGHLIDLTPITDITTANDKDGKYSFQFNPCKAFTCNNTDALACDSGVTSTNVLIPKGSEATCTKQGDSVILQYKTDTTAVDVTLVCSQNAGTSLKYESGSPADKQYTFTLSSRYACDSAKADSTSQSTSQATSTSPPSTTKSSAKSTGTTKTSAKSTGTTKTSAKSTGTTKTSAKSTGTTKTSAKSTGTTKTSAKSTGTTKTSAKITGTTKPTGTKPTGSTKTTMKKTTASTPAHTTHHGNASANSPLCFAALTALVVFINRIVRT